VRVSITDGEGDCQTKFHYHKDKFHPEAHKQHHMATAVLNSQAPIFKAEKDGTDEVPDDEKRQENIVQFMVM